MDLTRGPLGIPGIPPPILFGWTVQSNFEFVFLTAILTSFAYFIVRRVVTSPFGRVLRAIREDEIFAQSMACRKASGVSWK